MSNPRARIQIIGRNFDLSLPLGAGAPRQTAGGAVYEEQGRPQDVAVTVYVGDSLIKMDVPILLGKGRGDADQTPRIEQLFGLAQGSDGNAPPNFIARGPFENSGTRFQFEPPEYVDEPAPIKLADGTLVRQAMVLKLIEFQDPQDISFRRRRRQGHGKGAIGPATPVATVVIREGETLLQVSARIYGNPLKAGEIGKLNKIRDVRMKLKRGRGLRLPG